MKHTAAFVVTVLSASPAFAHAEAHVHAHGIEAGWILLATSLGVAGLSALAAVVVRGRK